MQYSDNASSNAIIVHVQYWQVDTLVLQSLLVCVCMYFECVRPCVGKRVRACVRVLNIMFCLNCSLYTLNMHL